MKLSKVCKIKARLMIRTAAQSIKFKNFMDCNVFKDVGVVASSDCQGYPVAIASSDLPSVFIQTLRLPEWHASTVHVPVYHSQRGLPPTEEMMVVP